MGTTLTVITGNPHKLAEITKALPEYTIRGLDVDLPEIQELDPEIIIASKLTAASGHTTHRPLLVEDVSLQLEYFNYQLPGPLIKWFLTQTPAYTDLLKLLPPGVSRKARLTCTLGILDTKGTTHYIHGTVTGSIAETPQSTSPFGFDPVFIPEGSDRSFGAMSTEEKQSYSHRGKALALLGAQLPHILP